MLLLNMTFFIYIIIIVLAPFIVTSNDHQDDIDFGIPGKEIEEKADCTVNDDADLLKLLNFKLKKFDPNPKDRSEIGEDPLSAAEIKTNTIRFYQEQLVDFEPIKITIAEKILFSFINKSSENK